MSYCLYYQARVVESECWFLVAVLRSFEHLTFDRTFDKQDSIFEFFVPSQNEKVFVEIMDHFKGIGVIKSFNKAENRLLSPDQVV